MGEKGGGMPWTPLERTENPSESGDNAPYTKGFPTPP